LHHNRNGDVVDGQWMNSLIRASCDDTSVAVSGALDLSPPAVCCEVPELCDDAVEPPHPTALNVSESRQIEFSARFTGRFARCCVHRAARVERWSMGWHGMAR
jgi:hypothetical protein